MAHRSYIDEKYADVYRNMFEIVDESAWMTIWKSLQRGGCDLYCNTTGLFGWRA